MDVQECRVNHKDSRLSLGHTVRQGLVEQLPHLQALGVKRPKDLSDLLVEDFEEVFIAVLHHHEPSFCFFNVDVWDLGLFQKRDLRSRSIAERWACHECRFGSCSELYPTIQLREESWLGPARSGQVTLAVCDIRLHTWAC